MPFIISKSDINKLFISEENNRSIGNSEEKGTGLGLSISYGIIKEMNGNISAESIENEYTKMIVELPIIT